MVFAQMDVLHQKIGCCGPKMYIQSGQELLGMDKIPRRTDVTAQYKERLSEVPLQILQHTKIVMTLLQIRMTIKLI